jgi:sigma-B regulation protein RsbU (phosphoserine phosphatase)
MIDEATYDDETLTLEPGDRLYFYTDGAIEALNAAEEEFGHRRLLAEIDRWRGHPLRAGLDRIAAAVRAWSGGPLKDDISLLAIERVG